MSLLVVTGPPGAGKSTVARLLAERSDRSVLVAGDAFYAFLASGAIDPWLPGTQEQNEMVTQAAAAASGQFVVGGYDTVYDGMVGPWYLPTFHAASGLAALDYAVLLPPVEVCVERVRTRVGHGFTDEPATRKMHHEFTHAVVEDRHVLLDPPADPAEVADHIAHARVAGALRVEACAG
jgi:cytidylate kinase